ncbi:STM4015 family protein [Catenulispora rubra]|uniref:STM4015 family protein n=1 Tax=Catenulispora rubra TaxID=280293 RepID=UPI001892664B|nr:STM4015 family protein [Catenulispora rubra]
MGSAWRIACREEDAGAPLPEFEEVFERFLDTVDTTRVTELVFGRWGEDDFADDHHPARSLVAAADRFPALRSVFFGDVGDDPHDDLVYVEHSDLTPVLRAFPGLEELRVRGMPDLSQKPVRYFESLRHTGLRRLVLESGGLHPDVVRAISACDFPELRHLELHLGDPDWCGWTKPQDFAWLLAGQTFPKLDHLGLRSSVIQDEIAAAVAQAPVVAGLRVLDLSLGALGDDGAVALLNGRPLGHLSVLDLHHHYISEPVRDRLRAAWPGVDVDLFRHRTVDESGRRYLGIGA